MLGRLYGIIKVHTVTELFYCELEYLRQANGVCQLRVKYRKESCALLYVVI